MIKIKKNNIKFVFVGMLTLSLYFGKFYYDIGFALKPYILITAISIFFLYKYIKFSKLYNFEIIMIVFILYYCMTALQFNYPMAHLRFILAFILLIVFYFSARSLIAYCSIKQVEKIIENVGIIGSISSLLYYFLGILKTGLNFSGNAISYYGLLLDRSIPRLTGTASSDPNIFVFTNTLYFFYFLTNMKSKKNKIGFILTLMANILTFSRGAYISIIPTLFLLILISRDTKKYLKNIFFSSTIFILIWKISSYFGFDYLSYIISRFTSSFNDGGSGRLQLWSYAFTTLSKNPIFGIGLNSTLDYNTSNYGVSVYTHNTILEVLSEGGLLGFSIYSIFWILIFYTCIKLRKKNSNTDFLLASFFAMFIQMLFLSILLNEVFYFMVIILFRYYKEYNNEM